MTKKERTQAEFITAAVQELHLENQGTYGEQSELDFLTLWNGTGTERVSMRLFEMAANKKWDDTSWLVVCFSTTGREIAATTSSLSASRIIGAGVCQWQNLEGKEYFQR